MNSLAPVRTEFAVARPLDYAASAFRVVLDLSRLISRSLHPTPTGVDRVEMAYAQELLQASDWAAKASRSGLA